MAETGTVFLMYHELALPGRILCQSEPGYTRYVISASDFRSQIEELARAGWHGKKVSQALAAFESSSSAAHTSRSEKTDKNVCITFDDGCETDLLAAAPILQEFGFGASFYITAGRIGNPGYLSEAQVRVLKGQGFEIGCHSLTHAYLTDVDNSRLHEEIVGAKVRAEQIADGPVEHFSCPGGRWNKTVAGAVKAANYRTMATSRTGLNFAHTDRFALNRVAVLKGTSNDQLLRACRGEGLLRTRLQEKTRQAAKRVLGNSAYDSLRGLLLGRGQDSKPTDE